MTVNTILDHIVAVERYREMLQVLTPKQIAVLALILNGDVADYQDAGEVLGLARSTAVMRMIHARRLLLAAFPELRVTVAGRSAQLGAFKRCPRDKRIQDV